MENLENSSVPFGYCQCGCGNKTNIAKVTRTSRNQIKDQPVQYFGTHNRRMISPKLLKEGKHWCSICKKALLTENFYIRKKNSKGDILSYINICKSCNPTLHEVYRINNRDKDRLYSLKYRLKTKYKISYEQYQKMLSDQNGVCKICEQPENTSNRICKTPKTLSIDHCHKTGKIRGLLCNNCNRGLGLIKDDTTFFQKAIKYLTEFQE